MRTRYPGPGEGVAPGSRRGWVARHFGRKQGLVRCLYHGVLDRSGRYARLGRVDWGRVERLVFVCQGNICRSAYAEARARATAIEALSFGLGTSGGDEPPPLMLSLAMEAGLDLAAHRSRPPATAEGLRGSDLVLAMEPAQVGRLRGVLPAGVPVTLLGLWGRPRRPHIEDPFGLSADYFRTCIGLIDGAVAGVAGRLGRRVAACPDAGPG